jgi:hypothetical protein
MVFMIRNNGVRFDGANYTNDEIREAIGTQHFSEEVSMVQPLIEQLNIPQNNHEHVHCPPNFEPQGIERI